MSGVLFLGFLIGMSHALEADHLAAVGAMAAGRKNSQKGLALRGAVWGLGHTLTLLAICIGALLWGFKLTDQVAAALEFAVGVMLVLLAFNVLWRMRSKRVHFHAHRHGEGKRHLHAHSHAHTNEGHAQDPHRHTHAQGFPLRALGVGFVHGAAGSAGLLALVVAATQNTVLAIGYVALFGFGSIIGMALLSAVIAWPLGQVETQARRVHRGLSYGAAALALYLGVSVMAETAPLAFAAGA